MTSQQTIESILNSNASSFWLIHALQAALDRDPVDAASDAETLMMALQQRCDEILHGEKVPTWAELKTI